MPPKSQKTTEPPLWASFKERFAQIIEELLPDHQRIANNLANGSLADLPNLVFFGARGFPIDLLVDYALQRRLALATNVSRTKSVYNKSIPYNDVGGHFLEFDFADPDMPKDITELLQFIKEIAQKASISSYCESRRIIVLKNVDVPVNQQPFRILLERYSKTSLFLCTTHRIASLEAPVRSRLLHLRVPLPHIAEIEAIGRFLAPDKAPRVPESRNLLRYIAFPPTQVPVAIPVSLEARRTLAYKFTQQAVPFTLIALELLKGLSGNAPRFIMEAANLEHKLACTTGGRAPLYIECLINAAASAAAAATVAAKSKK